MSLLKNFKSSLTYCQLAQPLLKVTMIYELRVTKLYLDFAFVVPLLIRFLSFLLDPPW